MITAIVNFQLPTPLTREAARALFLQSAPKYQALDDLLRKYYLLSADGRTAGGVYLWHSRAAAEAFYDTAWRDFIRSKYGCDPVVEYFETPVVIDNQSGEILRDD